MVKKIALLAGVALILFFWKDTILHLGTQSHDWFDGSFMVWSIQTNISHFKNLEFSQLFETNAMYPFPHSLSFTDHLYIPSLIALVISFFSTNPILQFNLLWILNHIAVFLTFYLLAKRFTKNVWARIIPAFYMSFGPYFLLQFGHLQMVFLWPLFLSLYFFFDPRKSVKSIVLSGVFLGVQFLTGTYLGLLGLSIIVLYVVVETVCKMSHTHVKTSVILSQIKLSGLFLLSFLAIAGISVYGYFQLNQTYHPQRAQSEFVTYSAHISDYLFPLPPRSTFLYKALPFWSGLNKHALGEQASFIGIVPILVVGSWWFMVRKSKNKKLQTNKTLIMWLCLLTIVGFVFSFGPRLNWNGKYLVVPLPYWFVMKIFPPIAIMRAVARWYFLVIFAVSTAMIFGIDTVLNHFKKYNFSIVAALIIFSLLEFYPPPVHTTYRNWKTSAYLFLQKQCNTERGPLLEYPIESRPDDFNFILNLQYKTNILMSSTLHSCPFLSGFSSFEPPLFLVWRDQFDNQGFDSKTMDILRKQKFLYVKINIKALSSKEQKDPSLYVHTNELKAIYKDSETIIYRISSK